VPSNVHANIPKLGSDHASPFWANFYTESTSLWTLHKVHKRTTLIIDTCGHMTKRVVTPYDLPYLKPMMHDITRIRIFDLFVPVTLT